MRMNKAGRFYCDMILFFIYPTFSCCHSLMTHVKRISQFPGKLPKRGRYEASFSCEVSAF